MGIFDKFFQKQEPTQKKEAPKIVFNKIDAYGGKHSNRKYRDYAKEGYQENAIVHRCIQLISNSASSVKLDVFDGDTKLDNHELISLLQRPNPTQSGIEFFFINVFVPNDIRKLLYT
jgi:phage portal protein BeeE